MRILKQEIYFPIIIGIHFIFWAVDLYFYQGSFSEVSSDTLLFGELNNESWKNIHRILGEVFSSWVVTVFAFNFLMATRARWVEKLFGGLDKMYLIHRRSGVIAVFLLLAHFIVVPRDLIAFNAGKPLGFYAFVLIIIGVVLSAAPIFKKKIPYHKWVNFHKLMGVFYVLGVIHGMLVSSLIQELPITRVYVFGMSFIGILAWVYRAFLFNFFNKKLEYSIWQIHELDNDVVEITMKANSNELEYVAGQFAFFTFPEISKREQHPFTLSSHPKDDNLRITVKGLGDFTNELSSKISIGAPVNVEGPYGEFSSSNSDENEQVWIAGGIGITPFLSMSKEIHMNKVTLYWCVNEESETTYINELEETSLKNERFDFILWDSSKNGHLTVKDLDLTALQNLSFYICGPEGLKKSIRSGLKDQGIKQKNIYDEEFTFR